ncbi:MAG: site-2 protease family protein [Minisyncoccia bacterium]
MVVTLSFVILIISIIAHEVAHGYAADALGDPTARLAGRLTMNPLPHIDTMGSVIIPALLVLSHSTLLFGWAKPVPYNPYNLKNHRWGETIVALAGVATNLFLAVIFGLIVRFGANILSQEMLLIAFIISSTNLFLGLFNLIPFPPLDGFTALRSALPWHLASGLNRFEHHLRTTGVLSLILFIFIFYYFLATPFISLVSWTFGLIVGVRL